MNLDEHPNWKSYRDGFLAGYLSGIRSAQPADISLAVREHEAGVCATRYCIAAGDADPVIDQETGQLRAEVRERRRAMDAIEEQVDALRRQRRHRRWRNLLGSLIGKRAL